LNKFRELLKLLEKNKKSHAEAIVARSGLLDDSQDELSTMKVRIGDPGLHIEFMRTRISAQEESVFFEFLKFKDPDFVICVVEVIRKLARVLAKDTGPLPRFYLFALIHLLKYPFEHDIHLFNRVLKTLGKLASLSQKIQKDIVTMGGRDVLYLILNDSLLCCHFEFMVIV
jgi:hypothetical protein